MSTFTFLAYKEERTIKDTSEFRCLGALIVRKYNINKIEIKLLIALAVSARLCSEEFTFGYKLPRLPGLPRLF